METLNIEKVWENIIRWFEMGSRVKNNDVYEIISKNVRRYRKEANITQEELALKANYSHQFIRRIEAPNVKKTFSLDTIYCISKALNKDFSDMFVEPIDDAEEEIEFEEKIEDVDEDDKILE